MDKTEDIKAALEVVRADETLQFDLPEAPRPDLEIVVKQTSTPRERPDRDTKDFRLGDGIATGLFWLIVGALVLGLVAFLWVSFRDVRMQARDKPQKAAPAPYVPDAGRVRQILGDVDALAAEGRYAEAVHQLLFRAIADIDRTRPGLVRRSLTSREIGRHPKLAGRTREAFVTIARINERGWFGGREITRADFETARAAYAQFDRKAEMQPSLSGPAGGAPA